MTSTPPTPTELPPVDPPSARFILQLFVIPFLVVVVLVCALLVVYGLFGKIAGSSRDALDYVQTIRSGNENRRWRAAYELASLIHNEPQLARDAQLQAALSELLIDELKKPPDQIRPETPQYLALALGAFEHLDGTADEAPNSSTDALLRALADSSPSAVRAAAAQSVARHAAKGEPALSADIFVSPLATATHDKDPETRQHAAYALGFFDSQAARDALAEVATDDNRLVRYNAAAALTRLDDPQATPVLREMLSPVDLRAAFSAELKDRAGPTQTMIEAVQLEALSALQDALRMRRSLVARAVKPDLEALSKGADSQVRIEARNTLQNLQSLP